MSSLESSVDENEMRFLRRATMLSRPSIPAREESPPSPFHPFLERSEKISVPSNPQERKITPTKSNNNSSPSKPSTSTKRAREQEQQEKEAASEPSSDKNKKTGKLEVMENAASEKKKASNLKDKENSPVGKKSSGGKKGDCNPKDEVARVPVACFEGGTSDGAIIKQFVQASTNVANKIKNEIIDEMGAENQKKFNQLKECIQNKVREAKHGSSNNRACDDFRFSSYDMIERVSLFKSKELLPLSISEMEEFEHKWREQEAIELEATIKRISLMQEELQLRMAKIRAPVNDRSS